MWTQEIATAIQKDGIMIRSVCPGANKTTITKNAGMPRLMIRSATCSSPIPVKELHGCMKQRWAAPNNRREFSSTRVKQRL
ncbi:hypothetical protein AB4124_14330 [Paenibacillus sp. 2KB_20]|uniref:hypothetical protein n=1 Tax=Paenibacillus sp. 2KB_20 TaxID=3232977 RepID=UPI003F9E9567